LQAVRARLASIRRYRCDGEDAYADHLSVDERAPGRVTAIFAQLLPRWKIAAWSGEAK